jgi:hypothetical protein
MRIAYPLHPAGVQLTGDQGGTELDLIRSFGIPDYRNRNPPAPLGPRGRGVSARTAA